MNGLEGVMRRENGVWLAAAALAALLACGCSGILTQNEEPNGNIDRLRVVSGDKWSSYDHSSAKENDKSIFLKKESTF
jgi:hypothetical protein